MTYDVQTKQLASISLRSVRLAFSSLSSKFENGEE